jgi:hypothetical protein
MVFGSIAHSIVHVPHIERAWKKEGISVTGAQNVSLSARNTLAVPGFHGVSHHRLDVVSIVSSL